MDESDNRQHERMTLTALRRLAEGATTGPWVARVAHSQHVWHVEQPDDYGARIVTLDRATDGNKEYRANCEADARFLATANPQTVLALLTALDRLAAGVRETWWSSLDSACVHCGSLGWASSVDAPLSLAPEHHGPQCIVPLAEAVGKGELK